MYKIDKITKEKRRVNLIVKVISIIIYSISIPIIIFNFTLIIKSFIYPNQTPDFFGYKNYIIVSGSMEPTIMTGDAIFVKKVPQSEINVNDIISFQDGNVITTHRIIEILEENGVKKYKTKGDNNNVEDKQKIVYEQIEGKYQFKINGFGIVIEILKNKATLILLIFVIIVTYLYKGWLENKNKYRKQKRENYNKEKMLK